MKKIHIALALASSLVLSGCGMDTGDRIISGSMFGAGFGAVLGVALDGIGPGVGAAAGAVVGGTLGYTTDYTDINLGKPIWRKRYAF
jgi:hypothetical protein